MPRFPFLLFVAVFISFAVFGACAKKEDIAKPALPATAAAARVKPADSADMVKAYALYDGFKAKFVKTLDYGMNIDAATEAQSAALRLAGEVGDSEAKAFLAKFSELLGQFRSEAQKAIAMNEKLKKDHDVLTEFQRKAGEKNDFKGKIDKMQGQYESGRADVMRQGDKVRHAKTQILTLARNGCCSSGECAGRNLPPRR